MLFVLLLEALPPLCLIAIEMDILSTKTITVFVNAMEILKLLRYSQEHLAYQVTKMGQ